jgi:hypothetical protein
MVPSQTEKISNEGETNINISDGQIELRTILTLITHALHASDVQLSLQSTDRNEISSNGFPIDITSLDAFSVRSNLDLKQLMAFDAICSSIYALIS